MIRCEQCQRDPLPRCTRCSALNQHARAENRRRKFKPGTTPQRVKCGCCGHKWVGFYLPQPIDTAATMMRKLCCPICGSDSSRITMAD